MRKESGTEGKGKRERASLSGWCKRRRQTGSLRDDEEKGGIRPRIGGGEREREEGRKGGDLPYYLLDSVRRPGESPASTRVLVCVSRT